MTFRIQEGNVSFHIVVVWLFQRVVLYASSNVSDEHAACVFAVD
jgi:hypothetical protein